MPSRMIFRASNAEPKIARASTVESKIVHSSSAGPEVVPSDGSEISRASSAEPKFFLYQLLMDSLVVCDFLDVSACT